MGRFWSNFLITILSIATLALANTEHVDRIDPNQSVWKTIGSFALYIAAAEGVIFGRLFCYLTERVYIKLRRIDLAIRIHQVVAVVMLSRVSVYLVGEQLGMRIPFATYSDFNDWMRSAPAMIIYYHFLVLGLLIPGLLIAAARPGEAPVQLDPLSTVSAKSSKGNAAQVAFTGYLGVILGGASFIQGSKDNLRFTLWGTLFGLSLTIITIAVSTVLDRRRPET